MSHRIRAERQTAPLVLALFVMGSAIPARAADNTAVPSEGTACAITKSDGSKLPGKIKGGRCCYLLDLNVCDPPKPPPPPPDDDDDIKSIPGQLRPGTATPLAPVKPLTPVKPVAPVTPLAPVAPVKPVVPVAPTSPAPVTKAP